MNKPNLEDDQAIEMADIAIADNNEPQNAEGIMMDVNDDDETVIDLHEDRSARANQIMFKRNYAVTFEVPSVYV